MASLLMIGGSLAAACGLGGSLLGFGTAGVAAGSVAAAAQSSIGNVAAHSVFATMTSLGMKGAFVATAIKGGAVAAAGAVAKAFKDIE